MSASIAARVRAFEYVRDTPYHIDLNNPANDNSCGRKAAQLQWVLGEEFGIESRRLCCRFCWEEVGLPQEIRAMAPTVMSRHDCLEVRIPETGKWVVVDPTWDSGLTGAALPIAQWDGVRATMLAVTPRRLCSSTQSERMANRYARRPSLAHRVGPFVDALNNWLEAQRYALRMPHA